MRIIIFKYVAIFAIFFAFNGCAQIYTGDMLSSTSLQSANFDYVRQNVKGTAFTYAILGIGGRTKSLIHKAKVDLLTNYPLRSNQALANQTVDFHTTIFLGVVVVVECQVYADIIEFNK
jgi:hypothetical protein